LELRYAHYLINSLNLQAISLYPLGGRGQGEGGYATADEDVPSQGRGDLVASISYVDIAEITMV
jgi:hypothetical protein